MIISDIPLELLEVEIEVESPSDTSPIATLNPGLEPVNAARSKRVTHPPTWRLRRFAEFFFSKKTFTQVLEPALTDMQKEHFDALAAGRPWQARMVLVRGYWSFWSAALAQFPISLARRVYEVWKATKTGN